MRVIPNSLHDQGSTARFKGCFRPPPCHDRKAELLLQVNLAPPEALHRVAALAEAADASVILSERGDSQPLPRHPNFRLLAAMNPATGGHSQMMSIAVRRTESLLLYAGAVVIIVESVRSALWGT